jgi:exportin-7
MMLDEFSVEQMMFTSMMPNEAFLYILEGCEQGVAVPNSWIRTNSCNVINNMCSFVIQENLKKNKRSSWLLNYIHPHLLDKLLSTLFGLILFDDNNDQWQLSRPLYTLVLLERDVSFFFFFYQFT